MAEDVLFVNGLVIDGLGGYRERADVLIEDSRIARVGVDLAGDKPAYQVIDLAGYDLAGPSEVVIPQVEHSQEFDGVTDRRQRIA